MYYLYICIVIFPDQTWLKTQQNCLGDSNPYTEVTFCMTSVQFSGGRCVIKTQENICQDLDTGKRNVMGKGEQGIL